MDSKLIDESADRIIMLFKEKEIDLSKKSIVEDLTKLVDEKFGFSLSVNDAVRVIIGKYARQHDVKIVVGGASNGEIVSIGDLKPNTWVTVEGEIVDVSKPNSDRIHQLAIITDGSGSIKVTVWNRKSGEPHVQDLVPGKWYKISNAIVNSYQGTQSLSVQKSTNVAEIDKKFTLDPTFNKISELKPGIVNFKGKIVKLFDPKSDKVFQSGIVGDETGTSNFVIWKSTTSDKPKLVEDKVYISLFAVCNKFNDKLSVSLSLNEMTLTEEDMEVKASNIVMTGNIDVISEGSGVIKRCTVEGCGRTLKRMNYCDTHEIQKDFKYDLRLKGIIDDGIDAKNIHVSLKLSEELLGMTLDEAIRKAETNPLGPDGVLLDIRDKLVGRYFTIEGNDMNGRLLVSSIKPITLDDMKHITGLDFKEAAQTKLVEGV